MKDSLYQFIVSVLDLALWGGELVGEENLPRHGPAVFIANHLDATFPDRSRLLDPSANVFLDGCRQGSGRIDTAAQIKPSRHALKKFSMKYLILATIILLSILGGIIDIYATANGPWGYNDPVEYIATAHSVDAGQGIGYVQGHGNFSPIRIHPPFYSLVLASIGLFPVNLIVASRWLNILAFMACIFMAGWIFHRYSRAPAMGILASALLLAFPQMMWMFSSAYSEPLFILLILSGGLCLIAFLQRERNTIFVGAAVLIGLTAVTRYAGIAMIAAGALSMLLFTTGKTWGRIRKAILFGFLASLPVLVWLIWVYLNSAHSLGGRSIGLDLKDLVIHIKTFTGLFIDVVGRWVPFQNNKLSVTYRLRYLLAGAGLAGFLALTIWAVLRLRKKHIPRNGRSDLPILAYFGLSAVFSVTVLLLTYLFTRPTIDIDNRMLLPFFVSCVMALFGAFATWQAAWAKEGLTGLLKTGLSKGWKPMLRENIESQGWHIAFQVVAWLVAVACLVWYIPQAWDKARFYHGGDGLTAYHWGRSQIIQAVGALPAGQPVISNDWQLLLLWTGRPIHGVWVSFPGKLPIQTTPYGSLQSDPAQVEFCSKGGALVIFNDFQTQFKNRFSSASDAQIQALFKGLKIQATTPDGIIYLCP